MQGGKLLTGFAGAVADALTLFEKFEEKLDALSGQPPASGRRAGQGVAQRSRAPAPRGAAHRRRCEQRVHHLRDRRDDRARGRHPGHRVRRVRMRSRPRGRWPPVPRSRRARSSRRRSTIAAEICIYTNHQHHRSRRRAAKRGAGRTRVRRAARMRGWIIHAVQAHRTSAGATRRPDAPSDRRRARPIHRWPGRRQEGGRHRAAQPVAPPARARGHPRRDRAEQHHPHRPHRRRARPRSPAGWRSSPARRSSRSRRRSSPRSATWGATWNPWCATWWRAPSTWCAPNAKSEIEDLAHERVERAVARPAPAAARAPEAARRRTQKPEREQRFRRLGQRRCDPRGRNSRRSATSAPGRSCDQLLRTASSRTREVEVEVTQRAPMIDMLSAQGAPEGDGQLRRHAART